MQMSAFVSALAKFAKASGCDSHRLVDIEELRQRIRAIAG